MRPNILFLSLALALAAPSPVFAEKNEDKLFVCSETNASTSAITLEFTGPQELSLNSIPTPKVTLTPEVKDGFEITPGHRSLTLSGKFIPKTMYTIRIPKESLVTSDGFRLKRDVFLQVRIPEDPPRITFLTDGTYFPLHAKNFSIPVTVNNIREIEVCLWRLYNDNLDRYSHLAKYSVDDYGEPLARKKFTVPPGPGEKTFPLDLEAALGGKEPGVYAVMAKNSTKENDYFWDPETDSRFLIITDLAVAAALNPEERTADIFVHSISTGRPAENAFVRILSRKGKILADGTTKDGIVRLRVTGSHDLEEDCIGRCVVRLGKDATILPLRGSALTLTGNEGQDFTPGCRAFTYAERGVARPGETIHASAFLRQTGADGKWVTPKNVPVRMMLRSPSGKIIEEKSVTSGAEGFLSVPFTIPENAPTGTYRILCGISREKVFGECSIMVAAYMPDRIRVGLTPSKKTVFPGEKVVFRTSAKYYFGGEIPANAAWKFRVWQARSAAPDFWKGWTVGEEEKKYEVSSFQKSKDGNLPKTITWPVPGELGEKLTEPVLHLAALSVTEPGGRAVTSFERVEVFPTKSYIGVRRTKDQGADALELTLLPWKQGESVAEEETEIRLFRKEWEYVLLKKDGKFLREWECRAIPVRGVLPEKIKLTSESVRLPLTKLEPGDYEIVAKAGARKTVFTFFHWYGEAGGRSMDPRRLTLKTDKEAYLPGDTAKLELEVPADSFALIVHGENGAEQAIRKDFVQGGRQFVEIPVRANVNSEAWHGAVTLVSRSKSGDLQRTFAFFTLKVDLTKHRLIPSLNIPEILRPGETLKGEIRLADPSGKPAGGLVHIFAVDEGILALTKFQTPDIFHAFYGPHRWNVEIHDMYELLYPDLKLLPDGTIGGGEGAASALSKRLESIRKKAPALVVPPPVTVPESGVAQWSFTLPDHTGALRVMAVAVSGPSVGTAEKQLVLRDEATAMVSLPLAVSPGDEFDVTVTVHNVALPDNAEITVNVEAPSVVALKDPPEWKIAVPRNAPATKAFRCRAGEQPGSGDFRIRLRGGPVDRVTVEPVTVRTGGALERRSNVHFLQPGASLEIAFPAAEWKRAEHALAVMGQPASGASCALEYLEKYPYGCVEQRVSGMFPYLALPDLIKAGLLDPRSEGTIRDRLEAASAEVLSMMRSNGSFPMWPGGDTWYEATVYASLFFFEAQARGLLRTDPELLQSMQTYVSRLLHDSSTSDARMFRAEACYALAVASNDAFVKPARNLLSADKPDFASLVAAMALIRGGYAAEGAAHLNELMQSGVWLSPESIFDGSRGGFGMLLTLLMENAPDDKRIPDVAARLFKQIRDGSNPWGTTQENAWAARGLAAFAARYPAKPCRLRMEKDGSDRVLSAPEKIRVKPDEKIRLVNEGEGAVLVRTESEGIPVVPRNIGGPIRLTKAYLAADRLPVRTVRHGEMLTVAISLNAPRDLNSAVLCCILPAGLEIENGTLATRARELPAFSKNMYERYVERRDDRFLVFFDAKKGVSEIRFTVRAVTRGVFADPICTVEEMYDPDMFGVLPGSGSIQIK